MTWLYLIQLKFPIDSSQCHIFVRSFRYHVLPSQVCCFSTVLMGRESEFIAREVGGGGGGARKIEAGTVITSLQLLFTESVVPATQRLIGH